MIYLVTESYTVKDQFANDAQLRLVPEWKVVRLPLPVGEFSAFLEKYRAFAAAEGGKRLPTVNFSNPIFPQQTHTDDMGAFLNRLESDFGVSPGDYRLYGNQRGQYPVTTQVLGDITAENLTLENRKGSCEFLINAHGQKKNLDRSWFENDREQREEGNDQFNLYNLLGYHNFGVIELNPACSCFY